MKWRAVDSELERVQKGGSERVFQRDNVIRRMIEDSLLIERVAERSRGGSDVALRSGIERCVLRKLVVKTRQPGVLVNNRSGRAVKLVDSSSIGICRIKRGRLWIAKCRIGKDMYGWAAQGFILRNGGLSPRPCLKHTAQLGRLREDGRRFYGMWIGVVRFRR